MLKPIARMLESSCVDGHGNHQGVSWHEVFPLLFWECQAAGTDQSPVFGDVKYRCFQMIAPKGFRSQLIPKLNWDMVRSAGQTEKFVSTQARQRTDI